jgi:hypothetical protein
MQLSRRLFPPVLVSCLLLLSACSGDDTEWFEEEPWLPQTTPENVLANLKRAYEERDVEAYAPLFADDFLFFFDPDIRPGKGLPEFWNKAQDSTKVHELFSSPEIAAIQFDLGPDLDTEPVNEVGREHWLQIDVDLTMEIDLKPTPEYPEGMTYVVDGENTRLYIRKGRRESDSSPESQTSASYYIVEWRARGPLHWEEFRKH